METLPVVETLQVRGSWKVADLEALPDDGRRYELIDGALVVSPAPRPVHQEVVVRLWQLLDAAAPDHLAVHVAPLDVVLDDDTVAQPDVLVAPREAFSEVNLPEAPLLAVEVLSPGTAILDLNVKKARYERAGIASYWIVDPESLRLTAYELGEGVYSVVAEVGADETWTAQQPFEVTITPGELKR
ncbi:MAG: Uma2 family endonuclease [Aeromicrobium sp.]|uniref:Uma2 family endonuclease n=1 Tax=Aeromicrobium sp. TaxID=1871063 RepID=UPI0039E5E578